MRYILRKEKTMDKSISKSPYLKADITVISFEMTDVICTSGGDDYGENTPGDTWAPV